MAAGTVLLYEDDPLTNDVLADTLHQAGHDVRVCGSPNQVMAAAARMPRSLALTDFWGTSYRYLADHERRQVERLAQAVPTILVTGRPWANDRVAIELGCRAFVPKPFRPDQVSALVAATIFDLKRAEHTPSIPERSAAAPDGAAAAVSAYDGITPRQQEVAVLIARGQSNAEIARKLTLSPGTVANHVEGILRRLKVHSRASIAVWAVEQGLYRSVRESPDEGPTVGSRCPTCGASKSC